MYCYLKNLEKNSKNKNNKIGNTKFSDKIAIYSDNNLEFLLVLIAGFFLHKKIYLLPKKTPLKNFLPHNFQFILNDTGNKKDEKNNNKNESKNENKLYSIFEYQKSHFSIIFFFSFIVNFIFSFFKKKNPFTMIGTSGTTGEKKWVILSLKNHLCSAESSNDFLSLQSHHNWLLNLPLYHVSGLSIFFRCLTSGSQITFASKKKEELKKITHLSLVPSQLKNFQDNPNQTTKQKKILKKLKVILIGGDIIPETIWQMIKEGYPFYPTYGFSENASQVATHVPKKNKKKEYQLLPHVKGKIQNGKIAIKSNSLFLGYAGIKNQTKKNGYFITGDLGKIKNKNLQILGRADNMFISGGENIYPEEIERHCEKYFLNASKKKDNRIIVVAKDDSQWGKIPIAFTESKLSREEITKLQNYLKTKIAKFKIPKKFYPLPTKFKKKIKNDFKISRHQLIEVLQK